MEKYLKNAILALILVSIAAKFILVFFNQGLWWDEAVYLGLGESLLKGQYSMDAQAPVETFRPPLFPFVISPVSGSVLIVRLIVVIISALSVAATYFLSKELFGRDVALWASLFLSVNHLFFFFSTKALTEPLFISLVSISLLFLSKAEKKHAYALLSGTFAGLAFLTRYLGTILIVSCLLFFIFLFLRRKRVDKVAVEFALFAFGFLAVISPWMLFSYEYYGNVLGSYFTNLSVFSGGPASSMLERLSSVLDIFGFQILFVVLGLFLFAKDTKETKRKSSENSVVLLAVFSLPIIFVLFASHVEPRYLLSYLPIYAIFFGVALTQGIKRINKFIIPIAFILCILSLSTGLLMVWNDRFAANALVEGSAYLKGITSVNDVVMSESYPYVYYLADRRTIRFPSEPDQVMEIVKSDNISYVLLYKFEPGNPEYTAKYFINNTNFERVTSFGQWGDPDAVRIYKVIR